MQRALETAGARGFHALTMNQLARDLGVTAKALYNHVRDRQDLVDAVAARLLQELPDPELDRSDWQESLRAAYRQAREAYRRFPRAILISLDETVTATRLDPARILLAEHMLQFFVDIGLSLERAVAARSAFLVDVFGFVLSVDYRYDRADAPVRAALAQPVPAAWLAALPETPAPLASAAAALTPPTSDEMFAAFVDLRIAGIAAQLSGEHTTGRCP